MLNSLINSVYESRRISKKTSFRDCCSPLHFVKANLTSGRQPAKSCEAHVSARIIRQTHRITMPLLSTYSPGLREHVRYPFHVAMTSKTYSIRL